MSVYPQPVSCTKFPVISTPLLYLSVETLGLLDQQNQRLLALGVSCLGGRENSWLERGRPGGIQRKHSFFLATLTSLSQTVCSSQAMCLNF